MKQDKKSTWFILFHPFHTCLLLALLQACSLKDLLQLPKHILQHISSSLNTTFALLTFLTKTIPMLSSAPYFTGKVRSTAFCQQWQHKERWTLLWDLGHFGTLFGIAIQSLKHCWLCKHQLRKLIIIQNERKFWLLTRTTRSWKKKDKDWLGLAPKVRVRCV